MTVTQTLLFNTAQQKVLSFLTQHIGEEFMEKEISQKTGVGKSAVNLALHELTSERIIRKKQIGRSSLFGADEKNNIVKEIKILQNIIYLEPLIEKLKKESRRIVLFGSCANGINTKDSDVDLFVLTGDAGKVRSIVNKFRHVWKVQLIIKSPGEMLQINKKKPLFFQEVEKGKILWETNEDEGI